MATRLKFYAYAVASAVVLSAAVPNDVVLASPGMFFALTAVGNTPDDINFPVFLGNSLFYSPVFVLIAECILFFKRRKT